MKVEFELKEEHLKILLLVFLVATLTWLLAGYYWRADVVQAQETSGRLASVVERQFLAVQRCEGKIEAQLTWLGLRHEGVDVSSWPGRSGGEEN